MSRSNQSERGYLGQRQKNELKPRLHCGEERERDGDGGGWTWNNHYYNYITIIKLYCTIFNNVIYELFR